MPEPLRIVMADDNYLVREGAWRLPENSGVVVAAAVGSVPELLDAVGRLQPAAVLTDSRMSASRLPRQIAGPGMGLGAAGLAGAALLAALVPVPAHVLSPDITYAAEWLTGIPVALFPVWLIVLSYRLPGHLAARVGTDEPPVTAA